MMCTSLVGRSWGWITLGELTMGWFKHPAKIIQLNVVNRCKCVCFILFPSF